MTDLESKRWAANSKTRLLQRTMDAFGIPSVRRGYDLHFTLKKTGSSEMREFRWRPSLNPKRPDMLMSGKSTNGLVAPQGFHKRKDFREWLELNGYEFNPQHLKGIPKFRGAV